MPTIGVEPSGKMRFAGKPKIKTGAKHAASKIKGSEPHAAELAELAGLAAEIEKERGAEVRRNQDLEAKNRQLEETRQELEQMMGYWRAEHAEMGSTNQKLREKLERRDQKISAQTGDLRKKVEEINNIEEENTNLQEKNMKLQDENTRLQDENTKFKEENTRLKSIKAVFESKITSLTKGISDINEDRGILKDNNASLREREKLLSDENTRLRHENDTKKRNERELTAQLREERQQVVSVSEQNKRLRHEKDRVSTLLADLIEERSRQHSYRRGGDSPRPRHDYSPWRDR
jgi:chromosome segregation ATPase